MKQTKLEQATEALIAVGVVENRSHAFAILEDAGCGSRQVFNKAVAAYEAASGNKVVSGGKRHTGKVAQARIDAERSESAKLLTLPAPDWSNEAATCQGFDFDAVCPSTDQVKRARAFIPTSMIKSGCAPAWKIKQAVENALKVAQGNYGGMLMGEEGIAEVAYAA